MRLRIILVLFLIIRIQSALAQDTDYVAVSYPGSGAASFVSKVETQVGNFLSRIDTSNAALLGFTAPVHTHTLGDPIPVAIVGLADSTLQFARAASSVIRRGLVPVYQAGVPGACLEISGSLPNTGRFGYAALNRRVLFMIDSLVYFSGWVRNTAYLVRIPAFNLIFVARHGVQSGEVYLTPVYDYPEYALHAGVEAPLGTLWTANLAPNFGDRSPTKMR